MLEHISLIGQENIVLYGEYVLNRNLEGSMLAPNSGGRYFWLIQETPEGIEMQFATNVLGYFWMTQAFSEQLKQSAPS